MADSELLTIVEAARGGPRPRRDAPLLALPRDRPARLPRRVAASSTVVPRSKHGWRYRSQRLAPGQCDRRTEVAN